MQERRHWSAAIFKITVGSRASKQIDDKNFNKKTLQSTSTYAVENVSKIFGQMFLFLVKVHYIKCFFKNS
jgi:hypothetical protein